MGRASMSWVLALSLAMSACASNSYAVNDEELANMSYVSPQTPLASAPVTNDGTPSSGNGALVSTQGQWINTAQAGWIWVPASATTYAVDNVPYTYLYTPTYGWTWYASPWGFGPFAWGGWVSGPWPYGYQAWYRGGGGWGWYGARGARVGGFAGGHFHHGAGYGGGFHGGGYHGGGGGFHGGGYHGGFHEGGGFHGGGHGGHH